MEDAAEAENRAVWESAFISPGSDAVSLPSGNYTVLVEKGPEWNAPSGLITIHPGETTRYDIVMERLADMNKDGWYGGDLHVHRPIQEMELIMKAEDLDLVSLQTWWNDSNAWDSVSPGVLPTNPVHNGTTQR